MKKLIALLLALVMVLAMVACGNANTPAETEAPKADAPAKETEAPAADETEAPAEEEPVVLTLGIPMKSTIENFDTNTMTLKLEEALNIDIQFVYFSDVPGEMSTQFGLMLTEEEELPDLVYGLDNLSQYNEYGQQGYLIDLKPYLTDPEKTPNFAMQMEACGPNDQDYLLSQLTEPSTGEIYNWPTYMVAYENKTQHHMYINQAWLDELGMEVPTTPDEMYEFLKAAKAAHPDGVGAIGALGYRSNIIEWFINAFIYCYDDYFWNVEDGQLYAPYTTDEYRQGLIWCNKLYAEGLIDPITLTSTNDMDLIPYATPAGTETSGAALIAGNLALTCEDQHPGTFDYAPAVVLDAGTGKGGYQGWRSNTIAMSFAVTEDCENIDKAIELLDLLCSPEMSITQERGHLGVHWQWVDPAEGKVSMTGTPATFEVIADAPALWQQQNNEIWNIDCGGIWSSLVVMAWNNDGTYGSQRDAILGAHYQSNMSVPEPDEVCRELVYLPDEQEVVDEVKQILTDYVRSQTHLFVSGQLDPSNDADWETFCKSLELQGMSKWQEAAQTAYTRMNG